MIKKYEKILSEIDLLLNKFNEDNKTKVKLVVKGSYVLLSRKAIEREINDINFCFESTLINQNYDFLNFLKHNKKFKTISSDANLFIFEFENLKLEFILFETISRNFTTVRKNLKNIKVLQLKYAFVQKMLMLSYIDSQYYENDFTKKLNNLVDDLSLFDLKIDQYEFWDNEKVWSFILTSSYNSFFIYRYYKYKDFLAYDYQISNKAKSILSKDKNVFKLVNQFWDFLKKEYIFDTSFSWLDDFLKSNIESQFKISENEHYFILKNSRISLDSILLKDESEFFDKLDISVNRKTNWQAEGIILSWNQLHMDLDFSLIEMVEMNMELFSIKFLTNWNKINWSSDEKMFSIELPIFKKKDNVFYISIKNFYYFIFSLVMLYNELDLKKKNKKLKV
ncbi:hypothetical protein [Mesomycoplasma lagogenitalium]|uniref:Uncharacterized protein n=1 Tax=Mesomycoplasma lagogenitalium TaxID=171286 RepID=A0ABY8LX33_9BACT|nr:hypothetical protein [Mesomycoplasma lagogenitalium]WGI36687.1 hypothetical protein QEG99_00155 [Mesomycoplasma lagogenitalium]